MSEQAGGSPLGEQIVVFRPSPANLVAGFILSAAMVGGGIASIVLTLREGHALNWQMPVMTGKNERGMSWVPFGLLIVLGIGFAGGGVALAMWCASMFRHCVVICADGFLYCSKNSEVGVPWRQVARIRHIVSHERAPLLKGPAKLLIPRQSSSSFVLLTADGKEFSFTPNTVNDIPRLSEILRDQSTKHEIAWQDEEVYVN